MAFTGIHVTCCDSGNPYLEGSSFSGLPNIPCNPYWSETLTTPGTTTQYVRGQGQIFRVDASADSYVAIGSQPNASLAVGPSPASTRFLVRAGTPYDFTVRDGDKLAWVAA